MLRLALLSICVVSALSAPFMEWDLFKKTNMKKYQTAEEDVMRKAIYENSLAVIKKHNAEADQGLHTYRLGVNQYADWTTKEFVHFFNGFRMNIFNKSSNSEYKVTQRLLGAPSEVDWRSKGYVTGVKNQEQCGSCWSFSATGSLEGQHFKKTGKLVSLSEQNLVDCSGKQGNMGCRGGLMDQAFEYIKVNNGIDTEASYPYEAKDGVCRFNRMNVGATDTGYVDIPSGNEVALMNAVANVGPISVAIDASKETFQLYKSGVYSDPTCSSTLLDHGVLAVGYGIDNNLDYWLVKNSWGPDWGMQGYIKMARNQNNMCGIATAASFPVVN